MFYTLSKTHKSDHESRGQIMVVTKFVLVINSEKCGLLPIQNSYKNILNIYNLQNFKFYVHFNVRIMEYHNT